MRITHKRHNMKLKWGTHMVCFTKHGPQEYTVIAHFYRWSLYRRLTMITSRSLLPQIIYCISFIYFISKYYCRCTSLFVLEDIQRYIKASVSPQYGRHFFIDTPQHGHNLCTPPIWKTNNCILPNMNSLQVILSNHCLSYWECYIKMSSILENIHT